jgi:flagellar hook protein FlgE
VTVYDKLGAADDLTVGLTQVQLPAGAPTGATSCWVWNAAGSGDLGDSTGATASVSSGGTLYFNSDGDLIDTGTAQDVTITPASDGAPAYTVSMDFSSMTSLASQSQFEASSQNGFPPGSLESYSIGTNGVITGLFTNGLTRTLAQIACAVIPNPNGLESVGENMYQTTDNSGVPVVGTAQSGGLGAIDSGYLEQSNVDISTEFTNLIVTQRGFEANTKVVTTIDQMLQDLMGVIQ